jgi:hypothetical protein
MQAEEKGSVTEIEEISYVAWGVSKGSQWLAAKSKNEVDEKGKTFTLDAKKRTSPAFFAAMQTSDGMNTAGIRVKTLNTKQVKLFIEEEKSKDKELDHTTEVVGYLALWGRAFKTTDLYVKPQTTKNSCKNLKGMKSICEATWTPPKSFNKFPAEESCAALVMTKGDTCANFCQKQQRVCVYAQKNDPSTCTALSKQQVASATGCD